MNKKVFAVCALLLLPSIAGKEKTEDSVIVTVDKKFFSPSVTENINENAIVVFIKRVRSLNMEKNKIYFKIYIDGENSVFWEEYYEGMDIYFEWPMAWKFVNKTGKISIQIQLWKKGIVDKPCDISRKEGDYLYGKSLELLFDIESGEWKGDDFLNDTNGYGHSSGYEDRNYGEDDYEIWFDIFLYDETDDRMTKYEKRKYGLDENKSYGNIDLDGDGIPCDWEDKYRYNPLVWDDHKNLDVDKDGLTNYEEYLTSQWLSDPFAKDIFVEVDGMKAKYPWQRDYVLPKESMQMICNAFAKHNITIHFDDGIMGGGGDLIPFDEKMYGDELQSARLKYFLNGNPNNWRRGVFHYSIIICQMGWQGRPAGGRMFYIDSHCVGGQYVRNWMWSIRLQGSDYITAMASVYMHELGHTLGLAYFEGCDNENTRFPWKKEYWEYGNYKSCMNYRYVFKLVDYSDGTHGKNDYDDWGNLDLERFNGEWW
ncbi:MAG: hypothetical protein H5T44_04650 [Thermoplasmatales archaeon]|nr:hypothetical protein [Thermoplasmatales archaeon]